MRLLLLPSLLWTLLLQGETVEAAVGDGGRLNTFAKPMLLLYSGAEVAHIETWQQAKDFCWNGPNDPNYYNRTKHIYSYLGSYGDWCGWMARRKEELGVAEADIGSHMHDGLKQGVQWVPVRDYYNKNNWVQIGKWNGLYESTCKTYREIYGIPNPRELAKQAPGIDASIHCTKPMGCTGDFCPYQCPHKKGYYPDKTDCKSYCHCAGSGSSGLSYWARVNGTSVDGTALIWDPYCANSDPLNEQDKPLGGMTGGCARQAHYVSDQTYCGGGQRRLQLAAAASASLRGKSRALQDGIPSEYNYGPNWGEQGGKAEGELNYVLCHNIPVPPEYAKTCGSAWGDPHFVTYDGLKYDVQGAGEYILSKSLDSGFELQAEFDKFDANVQATLTRRVVLQTGGNDEPKIEIGFHPLSPYAYPSIWSCKLDYLIDGVSVDVESKWGKNGTLATGTEAAAFFAVKHDRTFWFKGSQISMKIRRKHSKKMGCYLNVHVCIPDAIKSQRIVGLLGSPNDDTSDDFMDKDGNNLHHNGNTDWQYGHQYGTQNWCIRETSASLFKTPMADAAKCDEAYDDSLEQEVANAPADVKELCGADMQCLIEGVASGDIEDSVEAKRELEENYGGLEYGPTMEDLDVEEENEVFEEISNTVGGNFYDNDEKDDDKKEAGISGDPHIKSWSGDLFDFHGGCDLVLLQNPNFSNGLGMNVHIRTSIITWWSYIQRAALQLGENTLEITGGQNSVQYILNGQEEQELETKSATLGNFSVHFKRVNNHQSQTRVDLGHGNALSIETFKHFVRINMKDKNPRAGTFEGSVGLLGSYPEGKKMARNGSTLLEDVNQFGLEWQVLPSEPKLFHAFDEGAIVDSSVKCAMPKQIDASEKRRQLGEAAITAEEAAESCAGVVEAADREACISDVLATNDRDMVGAYL